MIEVVGTDTTKNEQEVAVWSVAMTDSAPRAWLCTQNPSNGGWITVTGGGAEFIEKQIESGMLGSAETSNKHGGFGGSLWGETYGDEVQPVARSED